MKNKGVAKKYLISVSALFIGGFLISLIIITAAEGRSAAAFTAAQRILTALGCAIVPSGSYTGFVYFGLKAHDIKKSKAVLLIIFFPLLLALLTISGIIMIIPNMIKAIYILIAGSEGAPSE